MFRKKKTNSLAVALLLLGLLGSGQAFFPRFGAKTAPSARFRDQDTASVQDVSIRIRKTVESDVPYIAELLAAAVVSDNGGSSSWRKRMDQLFAKADIEALLKGRLFAMREGKAAWEKISQVYAGESEEDRLKVMWATSERFRNLVEKASQDTGEENLWQTHNFVLTPPDFNWFNHLQITAEDVTTGKVVGFCEVAMISNPAEDDTCRITTATVDDDEHSERHFSPGITNLATAPTYRRQGIATRLLKHTERYVKRYWKAERMGLYVEKANSAAMSLYTKFGYDPQVTCDGGQVLGDLWYMVKDLEPTPLPENVLDEAEYSMASGR